MAINKHDDYEALAKLLYPSIEASGNVYYGQTRKLTLDEVLKRNSLGFDSHVESFYNESNSRYDSYFCWRLGSLHGSILVDQDHLIDGITASDFSVPFIKRILYADSEETIYDNKLIYRADPDEDYALDTSIVPIFGTIFAKYRLDKRSTTITNELNSGSYDSYEVDVEPVLEGIYVTDDFNPVNSIDDDISERHFYISKEKGVDYLYIQILTNEDTSEILTFTALEDSEISLSLAQRTGVPLRAVFYRVSQYDGSFTDGWEEYHYDWEVTITPTGPISLNTGRKIQFKSYIANVWPMPNNANDCLKFVINSGTLFVSGSCMSMCHPDTDESIIDTLDDYALYGLFSDVKNMYGTPVLPNVNKLGSCCYAHMFENCGSLTVAPKIKSSDTYSYISENDNYCYSCMFSGCVSLVSPPKMMGYDETDQYYHSGIGTCDSMFIGCTSLKISPVIRYRTLDSSSCRDMFYGCSSLKLIRCGAKYLTSSATKSWVYGVSKNGVFIKSTANYSSGPDGIPEGWAVVTKDDDYFAVHKEPDHGFRIDKHTPSDNYKNDYLVTSGTDSSTNGRGYIANTYSNESTIGKMERSFDENNTHPMNTYNDDGSFNQEIWGYKSFNSPVKFRNGLYGEDWSIYTCCYEEAPYVSEKSTVISRYPAEGDARYSSASIQLYSVYSDRQDVTNSVILSSSQPNIIHNSDEIVSTIEIKGTVDHYGNKNGSSIILKSHSIAIDGNVPVNDSSGSDSNSKTAIVAPYGNTILSIGHPNKHVNYIYTDYLYANNINSLIDSRISEILSTATPVGAPCLVYIDAHNSGNFDAYAESGSQITNGMLNNLAFYYMDGSERVYTGEYHPSVQVYLSDGSAATGTWEVVNSFTLTVNPNYELGKRKYFIAKRID